MRLTLSTGRLPGIEINSLLARDFVLEFSAERGVWGAGILFLLMGSLIVRAGNVCLGAWEWDSFSGVGFLFLQFVSISGFRFLL